MMTPHFLEVSPRDFERPRSPKNWSREVLQLPDVDRPLEGGCMRADHAMNALPSKPCLSWRRLVGTRMVPADRAWEDEVGTRDGVR